MKCAQKGFLLILVVSVVAVIMRLPRLEQRPMHTDEAVHADKFRLLLEENFYRYNYKEYHGPTLNYFTLIPAWLGSVGKVTEASEFTLRIVPVFFGVLLVLLFLLLIDGLGWAGAACAAVLTAISPAMVFYSRYYIQEILLVCFTFGVIAAGYRYTQKRHILWVLLMGVFLGLCHATKETCVIAFGSMLLALLLVFRMRGRADSACGFVAALKTIRPQHLIVAISAAVIVSALFYSSFFTNLAGVPDSFHSYVAYFRKADQNQLHIHRWYYYLKMLIYSRYGTGPVWSEAVIVVLAGIGLIVAMARKGVADVNFDLLRFIAFYTIIMTVSYSIIPYKTPWCMLGFLHGMILLAGVGVVAIIRLAPNFLARTIIILLLLAAGAHLAWQGYSASYKFYADLRNPYVYAHTSTDIFTITRRIKDVSRVHPDGHSMYIQVICPEDDYWPLPWYLRSFSNVGYWSEVDRDVPSAPVIIAQPEVETALVRKLYELPPPGQRDLYVPLFDNYVELRPQVELRGYITKELWDSYQRHLAQSAQSSTIK